MRCLYYIAFMLIFFTGFFYGIWFSQRCLRHEGLRGDFYRAARSFDGKFGDGAFVRGFLRMQGFGNEPVFVVRHRTAETNGTNFTVTVKRRTVEIDKQ